MDRLVLLQHQVETGRNGLNEPITQWRTLTRFWATRRDVSDGEKIGAGKRYSSRVARFVTRRTPNALLTTTDDRLHVDGEVWEVIGVKELSRARIEITAEVRSDA